MADKLASFDFSTLVAAIRQTHEYMAAQAGRAVNISLTLRNWVIGCYIREYEQNGADRAKYGENLFAKLSQRLKKSASVVYHPRELRRCREFYTAYPQIRGTLSPKFDHIVPDAIRKSLISESTAVATPTIRGSVSPELQIPPERLVKSLSFSHFAELIAIDDPLKRTFYEVECIRGNWSVRELKRQIGSLYYERSGLSENKEKLAELVQSGADQAEPKLAVRDPYIFEFLGIKPREVMHESDLEDALVEYALAGMDNHLFVSKYQLELPKKEEMQQFLEEKMREVEDGC